MISEILKTVEYLKDGGIIIYPSDTIWAIGCDATNSKAINKIFKIKKRDSSSPLICLMNDYQMLNKYVNLTKKNKDFLELQKKPTTIIFNKVKELNFYKNSIAVRIPNDEFCQKTGLFCCKMNVNVVIVFVKFRHEGSNSLKKLDKTWFVCQNLGLFSTIFKNLENISCTHISPKIRKLNV